MSDAQPWKRCSECKKPIALGALYWVCSVSTCNRKRTALRFCTVSCWDAHLPFANHREAWAEERTAPTQPEEETAPAPKRTAIESQTKRRLVRPAATATRDDTPREVLIVASRLKEYVRAQSGYKVSDRVLQPLSDIVRRVADDAIRSARDGHHATLSPVARRV